MRVAFNSIFGFAGVLDIGAEMRLARNKQDFGQTLGYWGVKSGAYVVLPFFGPSSVRDSLGMVVDSGADIANNVKNVPVRNSLMSLRVVDKRVEYLGTETVLEEASLDKYTFTRDLYLQRRANSIGRNTQPQDTPSKEERYDLPASATSPAAK